MAQHGEQGDGRSRRSGGGRGAATLALSAIALAFGAGCTTPASTYRYTGIIPAARPLTWDGRTAKDGTLRIEGSISQTGVDENYSPQLHDTALRVPTTTLEGTAMLTIVPHLEIGARYAYAAYADTTDSALGTEPLPSRPSSYGGGLEVHASFPLDAGGRWHLGFAGNVMSYHVPYAEWQMTGTNGIPACTASPTCRPDPTSGATYSLFAEKSESDLTLSGGIYPSVSVGPNGKYGHAFAMIGAHSAFKNDGFTDTAHNGSSIDSAGFVWMLGGGYGVELAPIHLAAFLYTPLGGGDSVKYQPGFFGSVGVDFELWESRGEKKARLQHERDEEAERQERDLRARERATPGPAGERTPAMPPPPPPPPQTAPPATNVPAPQPPERPGVYVIPI